MTTKPKARKFRIRRNVNSASKEASSVEPGEAGVTAATGQNSETEQTTQPAAPSNTAPEASLDIEDIRKEGLTGRQLRMARRMAHKHGLAPTSDFDAVRLLRAKGIDPFQRAHIVELVSTGAAAGGYRMHTSFWLYPSRLKKVFVYNA